MENVIKIITGSIATFFIYLLGGFDIALISLLIVIVLDYITGLLKASKKKTLSSKIGFKGIKKKLGILCLVALSVVIDHLTGDSGLVRTMVIYYLVANEGLSIIENLAEMDIGIPEVIKDKLDQLKDKGSDS